MVKHGDKMLLHSKSGVRQTHVWIVCPGCGVGRWIPQYTVKGICFTGRCRACHVKKSKDSNWPRFKLPVSKGGE